MITLQIANETDFKTIYSLASDIWNAHYVSIIGQQQVNYMLENIYNDKSLLEQLTVKKHIFYLIKDNDATQGFVSISSDNASTIFIHKLYINQTTANKGLGTIVLNLLIEKFKPKSFELTVNRQNYKSVNFYFKNGFKIERIADFDIGNGYVMNDFVMKKIVADKND